MTTSYSPPAALPDPTDHLVERYLSWLGSPCPWAPDRVVAGAKTRRAIEKAHALYAATRTVWDQWRAADPKASWLWSDLHLNHANILRYTSRTNPNINQMTGALLDAANERVAASDWLLFGGDVSLASPSAVASWLSQCPGQKVLILGNHDGRNPKQWLDVGFSAVAAAVVTQPPVGAPSGVQELWFTHYPLWGASVPESALNIHGHIHDQRLPGQMVNMCVEHLGMAPELLTERLARWSLTGDIPRTGVLWVPPVPVARPQR